MHTAVQRTRRRRRPSARRRTSRNLKHARDRVNLRLMLSRTDGAPSADERAEWIALLRSDLPPLPLSLCMLSPAGEGARLEPSSMGGWRLLQAQGKEEVEMEMAALVVPEGRPIRVHNDGTSQVNVKVLDGGLGRSAALLPGEIWSVLDADGASAGFELRLLVCSAENEMDTAGWCAALIRVEKCDATTQYGEDDEDEYVSEESGEEEEAYSYDDDGEEEEMAVDGSYDPFEQESLPAAHRIRRRRDRRGGGGVVDPAERRVVSSLCLRLARPCLPRARRFQRLDSVPPPMASLPSIARRSASRPPHARRLRWRYLPPITSTA